MIFTSKIYYCIEKMTEIDNCFICLSECDSRICTTCKCYAHKNCLIEYSIKNTTINSFILHDINYIQHYMNSELLCPVCKKNITNFKRMTRKDTIKYRLNFHLYLINYYLGMYELVDKKYIESVLKDAIKLLIEYKNNFKNDEEIANITQINLQLINNFMNNL